MKNMTTFSSGAGNLCYRTAAMALLAAVMFATKSVASSSSTNWSDSYSVGGQCYCDTNFDHGLRNIQVTTPEGRKSVPDICADIRSKFGTGMSSGRTYYNTVQCGLGPANTAADEAVCPGIPLGAGNYSGPRCQEQGASWNLEELYGDDKSASVPASEPKAEPVAQQPGIAVSTDDDSVSVDSASVDINPSCPDPDGDGYGYVDGQSCRTDGQPIVLVDTTVPVLSSSVCIDPDGDGWGFANGVSCLVGFTEVAEIASENLNSDDEAGNTECIDPDGDGYGYANGQSCRTDGQPIILTDSITPILSSDICIDDDGDGYGFANGASCLVSYTETVAIPVVEQTESEDIALDDVGTGCIDTDGDGYGYANGQSCRTDGQPIILTDSITPILSSDICIDDDGDGYGYANGASCLVSYTETTAATSVEQTESEDIALDDVGTECIDPDGDGYGYANGKSCRTDGQPIQLTDSVTSILSSDLCIDEDGDGYGFANGASCLVSYTDTDTDTDTDTGVIGATNTECVDPDGDGYGYVNGQSCRTDGQPIAQIDPNIPVLSSAICIDHDGDGWGYANQSSCLVADADDDSTNADSARAAIQNIDVCPDPDGDGYGYANGQSCRADGQPIVLTDSTVPTLEASICIDDDGDGWGYANGASCLVDTSKAIDNVDPDSAVADCTATGSSTCQDPADSVVDYGSDPVCSPTDTDFNSTTDLLVLHYDFGRDPDDGHAAVANKVLIDRFAVEQLWVVSGTNSLWQNNYLNGTDSLMNQIYGDGGWIKANILDSASWQVAVTASVNRWRQTLNSGGNVWVAEAGPGDFTYAVMQQLKQSVLACELMSRIVVVQHSVTNERNTGRDTADNVNDALSYVQSNTRYLKIDDGNARNSTADLHANNNTQAENVRFINKALASVWSGQWQAAFAYLPPGVEFTPGKLDFSDTVELLYILNVPVAEVSDFDEFADRYF